MRHLAVAWVVAALAWLALGWLGAIATGEQFLAFWWKTLLFTHGGMPLWASVTFGLGLGWPLAYALVLSVVLLFTPQTTVGGDAA